MKHEDETGDSLVSNRAADIVVALILVGVGALVMIDSLRLGAGWGEYGPKSGYFPFYTGLLIVLSSLGTIGLALFGRGKSSGSFVGRGPLRDVLKVIVPSAAYVALIGFIGIYVASALFIGAFMRWLGRFRWHTIIIVSIAVPFSLFLMFEIWFLVPLPKGPLENLLGY
ncbi:MAG: tripartite tricarboxylate transporter TctB family protein [Rhodospirillales bacterium]|nr:tripartite tricarboxylate transporter TctB family protein [Rhodospirillales bacterium]